MMQPQLLQKSGQQAYTATVSASYMLMLIEYVSFNMQSKIGNGFMKTDDDFR
ncbi:MAG: hypothetical protein ACK5JH_11920 [Anaerocolumna sp.]